jgi:hypothetical protein
MALPPGGEAGLAPGAPVALAFAEGAARLIRD